MNLWDNVDKVVKEQGTNLALVSEMAGISYDTVRNWRTRHIYPRVDEAKRLSDALGVSVEKLFFDIDYVDGNQVLIERLRRAECTLLSIQTLLEKEDPC